MAEEKKTTTKTTKAQAKPAAKSSDSAKNIAVKKPATTKVTKKEDAKVVSEVKAHVQYLKIAPRKARLVLDQIRGMQAEEAIDRLRFIKKAATKPISKLLLSAVANAENNFEIDKKDLFIKKITADDGPTLKRFRPRAQGRSAMIRKRTSNIDLILGVKPGAAKKVAKKVESKKEDIKIVDPKDIKQDKGDSSDGPNNQGSSSGKGEKGFMKGMFQRKTG